MNLCSMKHCPVSDKQLDSRGLCVTYYCVLRTDTANFRNILLDHGAEVRVSLKDRLCSVVYSCSKARPPFLYPPLELYLQFPLTLSHVPDQR